MADEALSSNDDSRPELEARQARPEVAVAREKTRQRFGEVYLIERQAIELRRLRWSEHARLARSLESAAPEPSLSTSVQPATVESAVPEPSLSTSVRPLADPLAIFKRPSAEASESSIEQGFIDRVRAWLGRAFWGN